MKYLFLSQIYMILSCVRGTPEVIGKLNGFINLPCTFSAEEDVVIHWTIKNKESERVHVHSYYEGSDRLENQDQRYKGRTSLFLDQIRNGNASLQLKNLQKSDENVYTCYVSAKETTTLLKVEGVILFTVAVWGEQCKNVTIPCSFNPGKGVVIHWTIASNQSQIVHRYFDGQDKLNVQDESYKGRTSLFLSELTNGNASLQLKDLQEGDENIYSCYVGTETESKEDKVKLNVADFRHSIEYALDHDRLSLKCHASHVYPSDTVTIEWYDDNNNKIQQDFNTSSSCTSCNVKNKSYKCILRHSLVQSTWTGMWETKAYEQGRVACTCNFCKTANAKSSVRLYLRKNGTEVPVASENSSSLLISDTYLDRVQGKRGEYSLFLNTADDSGDYMCESRTSDRIIIAVTPINNTPTKETQREEKRERWSIGLSFVVLCFCMALFVYFSYCKTNKDKRCIQNKDDKEENSSAPMKDDDKESSRVPLKDDEESSDAPMKGDDSK